MGRKKLALKRIENAATRQLTYSKRKDGIIKKCSELSVLCDTHVALIMFSPTGRLTTFASNDRIEDIFLGFVQRPDEQRGGAISNEEFLVQRLNQLKYEGEMLEKLAVIEELQERLDRLKRRQREAHEKMRYYEPEVEKMNSALEAGVAQQFLTSSIQRVQLAKGKLLGNQIPPHQSIIDEEIMVHDEDAASATNQDFDMNQSRMSSMKNEDHEFGGPPPL